MIARPLGGSAPLLSCLAGAAAAAAAACGPTEGDAEGGPGSILVQISGEDLGTEGFGFPDGSEVVIADGWEVRFDHVLVTIGRVWLSEAPDLAPSDASRTGAVVSETVGPWAVDLAKPGELPGAGGEGTAIQLFVLEGMNRRDDEPFAPDQRYAFGYSTARASQVATRVNFDGEAQAMAAYEEAIAGGCSLYLVGTASFRGGDACEVSDAAYDFDALPGEVPFALCFGAPTRYENCQNAENQGEPHPDESFQRGVPIKTNAVALAQITLHLDHPFYSDVEHEPVLYFDQLAARLVGAPPGTRLTIADLTGVDVTAFTDRSGAPLPSRRCDGGAVPSPAQRAFGVGSLPVGPGQDPTKGLRDYADYIHYVVSTQGHLNSGDGLCFTQRDYASPP